jgi:hypothetical protein
MKNYQSLIIIIALSGAVLIGCSDMGDPVAPTGNGGNGGGGVDYASQIQPIFDDRCISCHSGANPIAGLNLSSYTALINSASSNSPVVLPNDAQNSYLVKTLEDRDGAPFMPQGGTQLPASQIALIRQWIDEGALETGGGNGGGGGGGGNGISFTQDVMPILQGHCVICHSPPDPQDNFDLSTYAALMESGNVEPFDPDDSELVEYIEGTRDPRMPLGGPYLAQETINVIRQWIEEGAVYDG